LFFGYKAALDSESLLCHLLPALIAVLLHLTLHTLLQEVFAHLLKSLSPS
jgi:hypothetical protein